MGRLSRWTLPNQIKSKPLAPSLEIIEKSERTVKCKNSVKEMEGHVFRAIGGFWELRRVPGDSPTTIRS